ncbi:MAG: hypothetical protein EP332_06785 [Bacteroidetes bacterium]|nr:MAG: hypothetical protein EP332_06785 [Bacteroidota bacterium]
MYHACKLKFGAVTNLTDARYAAAVYADWIGFRLDPSHPRYIDPAKAKEIIDWISGSSLVAELGTLMPDDILSALEVLQIDTVQVSSQAAADAWKLAGYEVILEGVGQADYTLSPESAEGQHLLDITDYSMEQLKDLQAKPPFAIQINGGDETGPGLRDFADIDDMLAFFELEE